MGKYLKKFETTAQYESEKDGLILPNVSLITETNGVAYNPYIPPIIDGHDYVEIDGVKWATMNIGATGVTDYGLYFQWGDTQGYTASQVGTVKIFNSANYKFSVNGSSSNFSKYSYSDGLTTLETSVGDKRT